MMMKVSERFADRIRGFTLIEILVVISIVGLLVALLLPALQSSREVARRARCVNNLRQFGIAIQSYSDTYDCLPIGRMKSYDKRYSGTNPPCTSTVVDKSIHISILPFIEQHVIYNAINQNLSILCTENQTVHVVSLNLFVCPSDPESGGLQQLNKGALINYGVTDPAKMAFTNYVGSLGTFAVIGVPMEDDGCKTIPQKVSQNNGVFNDISPITLSSIQDGLSNTLFMSEKSISLQNNIAIINPNLPRKYGWYITGNWGDTLFTTYYPPNAYRTVAVGSMDAQIRSASSNHPGGVNILIGDGSVRFVKDTVDSWETDSVTGDPIGISLTPGGWYENIPHLGIWQSLSTRSGGEIVGSYSF